MSCVGLRLMCMRGGKPVAELKKYDAEPRDFAENRGSRFKKV